MPSNPPNDGRDARRDVSAADRSGGNPRSRGGRRRIGWVVLAACVLAAGVAIYSYAGSDGGTKKEDSSLFYTVRRGNLTVSVTEGGTIKALESQEIKSEAQGQHRILSIVPEGTRITREDVEAEKVLVELDSSDLEEEKSQREISFQSAKAAYTEAQESFEIQKQQNESNIALAELNVKFARMDMEQFLGQELTEVVMARGDDFDFTLLREFGGEPEGTAVTSAEEQRSALQATSNEPAYTSPASGGGSNPGPSVNLPPLGGESEKQRDELLNNVTIAAEQLERAEDELGWSQRLAAREYITQNQLKADELAKKKAEVNVQQARTSLALFLRYQLPKDAEQLYSDCKESKRELKRVEAKARSQLAQAEANLMSKEASFELQKKRLERVIEDIENCTIKATRPGMVVYASTVDPRRFRDNPIQEGYMVREKETIMVVPDMSTLAVEAEVHETDIQKLEKGQRARISLQAIPDQTFQGHVEKISVMASSEHRWLNPDTMVYPTKVALDALTEEVKPGMSATAEIIVAELKDIPYVPIQAVTTRAGKRVCWVKTPEGPELREVEVGHFTDQYVEIKSGLKEGEQVYLAIPEGMEMSERPEMGEAAEETVGGPEEGPGETRGEPSGQQEEPPGQQGRDQQQQPDPQEMRERLQNMSPQERREFIQQRTEQMSDEEREQMMQRMRRRREGAGGPGPGGPPGGGRPGGGRSGGPGGGRGQN